MEKSNPIISISVDVYCPNCEEITDLRAYDDCKYSEKLIGMIVFNDESDFNQVIECHKCKTKFIAAELEY